MKRCLIPTLFLLVTASAMAQLKNVRVLLEEKNVENAYPRFSKDGKSFLYQSNRSGKWQIYIYDIPAKSSRQLTTDTFNNNFPDWTADNNWIAFVSDRDGNEELYLMKADGSGTKRLTNNTSRDIHPYFSPDGKYLLFNSDRNGTLDIYRLELAGNKVDRLTDTPEDETCAKYSSDMKHIVFLRNSYAIDDLFVMDLSKGLSENISKTPAVTDGWPVFSPDGKWIYFSSMETGSYCIYKIKPDGSEKQQLSFAAPGEVDARVSVSKDGRKILFNKKVNSTISVCEATL